VNPAVGFAGWALALAGLGMGAVLHFRLARQSDVVARASHELRGPLTAARLGLEPGLRGRQLPPRRLRAIELELGRASLALEDMSAPPTRRHPPRLEVVELPQLAADLVEAWRPVALARGTELRFQACPGGALVRGERLRLAQAIGNLVANAIEHGGDEVEVRLWTGRAMVRLEVVDSGPGLPAPIADLGPARRRWSAVSPKRGHGLAIVRAIAASHGGRLIAAPSGRGARLVLEFPAADARGLSGWTWLG
jgi:signal transduction histidine kinase